jgi:sulfur carrier protein ThiS adenylyltransferase
VAVDNGNPFEQGLRTYLSPEQLAKIQSVRIGIAGAGGLGSNCAQMLVRCGFRRLTIVDFDVVEPGNLNRQFYFLNQIGQPKVQALRENLLAINPACEIETHVTRLDQDNITDIFVACDIIVEAFDTAGCKKLIVEAFFCSDKFMVGASGLGGWGHSDRITVHRMRHNLVLVGDMVSAATPDCPPLAPCVTVAAAKQADEVLNHVLGDMP